MTNSAILPRNEFRSALAVMSKVAPKRTHLPILAHAALVSVDGALALKATDLDFHVTATIPGAVADDGFRLTLPAHKLAEVEKKAPATDHVAIDGSDESGSLDFEGLRVRMDALPYSDFPEMEFSGPIHADFTLPTAALRAGFEATMLAISTEETRYYLNGVYLHVATEYGAPILRMVATDGHKLSRHNLPSVEGMAQDWGVIVPRAVVEFLYGLVKAKHAPAEVRVIVNTSKVRFQLGNVDVIAKMVDGTFPDYQRVIPASHDKVIGLKRLDTIAALKAVSCISSERGRAVRLEALGDKLRLTVRNPELGDSQIDVACSYDGPVVEIGFNAEYLIEILSAMDSETVRVELLDSGYPAKISGDAEPETLFVLMPVRV